MLELTTKIAQKEDLIAADLDDEVMMMSLETNSYFAINSVGSDIWQAIQQPKTVAEICALLQATYDVDYETCLSETHTFLQYLIDEKVARIVEA